MSPQYDSEMARRIDHLEKRLDTVDGQNRQQLQELADLRGQAGTTRVQIDHLRDDMNTFSKALEKMSDSVIKVTDTFNRYKGAMMIVMGAAPLVGSLAAMLVRWLIWGAPPSKP